MIRNNTPGGNEEADTAHNDDAALETESSKQGSTKVGNDKTSENDPRIETVVPDNDN